MKKYWETMLLHTLRMAAFTAPALIAVIYGIAIFLLARLSFWGFGIAWSLRAFAGVLACLALVRLAARG